jgi:nucleoside permease NupC
LTTLQGSATRSARLEIVPLASAVTVVALAAYLVCAAVAFVSLDLLVGFFEPWFHGVSLQLLRPTSFVFRPEAFLIGAITFGASSWVATAAAAWLYDSWISKR